MHNVRVPGMVHGAWCGRRGWARRSCASTKGPCAGCPASSRWSSARTSSAWSCEKPWQAMQAARALKATWKRRARASAAATTSTTSCGSSRRATRSSSIRATSIARSRAPRRWSRRPTGIRIRCTDRWARRARWRTSAGRRDHLVVDAVGVSAARTRAAMLLGLPPEQVRVVFTRGSGCYGINGADTVSYDAALLSQAVGRPVRVQLSRQDEMAWENYGFAYVIDQRVGLDAAGTIVAWDCEAWYPALGGRPGYDTPGNVVTGMLAGFEPAPFAPRRRRRRRRRVQQRQQRRAVVRDRLRRRPLRRHRHDQERARADAHDRVAVLHRPAAIAEPAAEHVRARVVHGRNGGAREGRSGGIPAAPPARSAPDRGRARGREGRELGDAAVAERRGVGADRRRRADAGSRACSTKATTATARSWRRSTWIGTAAASRVTRLVVSQDCGPISIPTA